LKYQVHCHDYPDINLHLRASYDIIIVPAMSIINGRKKKKKLLQVFYAPTSILRSDNSIKDGIYHIE